MTPSLLTVLIFSLLGGVVSLAGGLLMLYGRISVAAVVRYATPFAAGALLAAAFTDLLPHALEEGDAQATSAAVLIGILLFFLLERFLFWFHHHHEHDVRESAHSEPNAPLIIVGDTIHNFIDGIAIAAGFLINTETGIIVTLAVAAHEIPQEIGDFALLLKKGMSRRSVIGVNILSALATTAAALLFFVLGQANELPLDAIQGLVAGFFVYIAVSDIIPSIHQAEARRFAGPQTLMLMLGVLVVAAMTTVLHDYIEAAHDHPEPAGATQTLHEHEASEPGLHGETEPHEEELHLDEHGHAH